MPEFDGHERVVALSDESVGLSGFIAIHRQQGAYPSLGATRLWQYDSAESAVRDALRLSRLMSYKSAMAGLPYGGAKAVLMEPEGGIGDRSAFFHTYAERVNELEGAFVTGSDVGVDNADLEVLTAHSAFIIGNGVDAGYYTARGVYMGIGVCLERIFGTSSVVGRRFAVQGLGKTGSELVRLLSEARAGEVFVCDIDPERVTTIVSQFPEVRVVDPDRIHAQDVDVLCPCALSHTITRRTVYDLRCRAIVGSANNQLEHETLGSTLHERGVYYAPDYVVNSGGMISVVDQFEHGAHDSVRIEAKLAALVVRLRAVLSHSEDAAVATHVAADTLAHRFVGVPVQV